MPTRQLPQDISMHRSRLFSKKISGLITPPDSPQKTNALSRTIDEFLAPTYLPSSPTCTLKSSLSHQQTKWPENPITPPLSPIVSSVRTDGEHQYRTTMVQLDGANEELEIHDKNHDGLVEFNHKGTGSEEICTTYNSPAISTQEQSPGLAHKAIKLSSAEGAPFQPAEHNLGQPGTPLVDASYARVDFPFPSQSHISGPLTPLKLRLSGRQVKSRPKHRFQKSFQTAPSSGESPDRFIPTRRLALDRSDSFRMNKDVDDLTHEERILRRHGTGADPFSPCPRRNARIPVQSQSLLQPTHSSQRDLSTINLRRASTGNPRLVSDGAIWTVGGSAVVEGSVAGIPDGRGGLLGSGTNAPLYSVSFFKNKNDPQHDREAYEQRIALALDVDQATKILETKLVVDSPAISLPSRRSSTSCQNDTYIQVNGDASNGKTMWVDNEWIREGGIPHAPSLRDDYYTTPLAYSPTANCLAVGLGSNVYLWSETRGVEMPGFLNAASSAYVTSLSFSSSSGGKAILATSRADGRLTLWSSPDSEPRFHSRHPSPITCVCFAPIPRKTQSKRDHRINSFTEDLLAGDETGMVYYYSVEWPSPIQCDLFDWSGEVTLIARIACNSQQICGLAWSPDTDFFATGGNDNTCYLFETRRALEYPQLNASSNVTLQRLTGSTGSVFLSPNLSALPSIGPLVARHSFRLRAAVKALAFCPHQRGLLALGGGSNDRQIHFVHTLSGATLSRIDCCAQVTSLIWSKKRREICATFGFAQPDHNIRVAVFGWPGCEQLVAIPWPDEHRALWAIPCPTGPDASSKANDRRKGRKGSSLSATGGSEGCIVVATSDASIKFHEVWSVKRRASKSQYREQVDGNYGLAGSTVLGALHGVEMIQGRVIR